MENADNKVKCYYIYVNYYKLHESSAFMLEQFAQSVLRGVES